MTAPTPAPRPEPVLTAARLAAAVSGVIAAVGAVLTLLGWSDAGQVHQAEVLAGGIVTSVATLAAVVAPMVAAYRARAKVTPLSDPRDAAGAPLVAAHGKHEVA